MDLQIASNLIRENTIAYAKQILSNMFPNVIDGFKKSRRRILYTAPTDKLFSGQLLISNTSRIHPYGDISIYDTACRMVGSFQSSFPLLNLIGNSGSYCGDRPASSRYTEFKLSDFCKDVFFTGINFKTIPMELTEDLKDHEIKYFIPKIPTALLYSNESIGFGYSSLTIPMKFENVCDLVSDYVSCTDKTTWNYSHLMKLFIPLFSIHVYIKNKSDLIDAYKRGQFNLPVETEGHYQIISSNTVLIRTMSYGISPKMIRDKIESHLKDKTSWLAKNECNFIGLSSDSNYADFQISIKRGVSIFELIEKLKKITSIRTSVHPINNYVFDERMYNLTPPDIIAMWYKERYRSIFSAKKHRQQELQSLNMRYSTYLIVCEHIDEVVSIIRSDKPEEQIYIDLKTRFELSTRQCKILLDSNLQILMRAKKKELEDRLLNIKNELETLNDSFQFIDNEILNDIRYLKKKYKTDMTFTSRESEFIGCIIIFNHGILQISSFDELIDIAKIFSSSNIRFIPYFKDTKTVNLIRPNESYKCVSALPYTSISQGVVCNNRLKPFLFIRDNNRSSIVKDHPIDATKSIFNFVSKSPKVITSSGNIEDPTDDLFVGKKFCSNIFYAFDIIDGINEYVVISINEAHPLIVRFQQIDVTKDVVMFSNAGETSVLGVYPKGVDDVLVNLPHFSRHNFMMISDIEKHSCKHKVNDISVRNFTRF